MGHCHLFDPKEWVLAPVPTFLRIEATEAEWKAYAALTPERRLIALSFLNQEKST